MLTLTIVTPSKRVVGPVTVQNVTVPGSNGEMTVLPGHATFLGRLIVGILSFEQENGKKEFAAISRGFIDVKDDKVTLLAETLEMAKEIDADRARRAKEKAEEKLHAKEAFEEDMEKWQRKHARALTRLQAKEFLLPPH